ncbi:DUF456 domain-containing protein [Dysgonomonas sp. 216]|uniref:DUF456 domain-containing protein n=1 Tax=Dysgonomonas sp. 216 TaxID=2302934 RepID=UPI0013D2F3DE|nr:DUF456 domain-containing protein [Dysgonomonas sp. 216]NDW18460.1 DUF456 domain-containing protein [Dysgonomonas sp. 216]
MAIDIILIISGFMLLVIGFLGCILPAIPGVPLSYIGILLLHFTSLVQFSPQFLIGWAIVVIIVQIMDYIIPAWGTKKFGGGKKGVWGCVIGSVAGIFIMPPWGIIFLPFVGAVIGELFDNKPLQASIIAGFGAFLGFLAGTLIKIIVALILTFYFIKEVILIFF